jgi:hypothetical protein
MFIHPVLNMRARHLLPNLERQKLQTYGIDDCFQYLVQIQIQIQIQSKSFTNNYKHPETSFKNNKYKSGKGIRVRSISEIDNEGNLTTTYYNKEGTITNQPLDDIDLLNLNDNNVSETNSSNSKEVVSNQSFKARKIRKDLELVEDDNFNPEGLLNTNKSKLTKEGKSFIEKTKKRRAAPLVLSKYENPERNFFPVYSLKQRSIKGLKHTPEILRALDKNATQYDLLSPNDQAKVDFFITESLLDHHNTKIYDSAMGQAREPIFLGYNDGKGVNPYPIPNHIITFSRQPGISNLSYYITNYQAKQYQIDNFFSTNNTIINYKDLFGIDQTNIGPIFGKAINNTINGTSIDTINATSIDTNPEL